MNLFSANEQAAATLLRSKATHLVCTYADPQDMAAARLAVLLLAAEQEAKEQGLSARVTLVKE